MQKPELKISVFSDYICPFCYIGHHRLQRLKDEFTLRINWCFIEIHPETPATGMASTELDYSDQQWQQIVTSLNSLIEDDQLPFRHDHTFTTNSHKALLLAESAKPLGADIFYCLHNRLYEAFFVDRLNIGDEAVLRQIANECQIPGEVADSALTSDSPFESNLKTYLEYAARLQVTGVPTTIIGDKVIPGVASYNTLLEAARNSYATT